MAFVNLIRATDLENNLHIIIIGKTALFEP
jgi:hypothetical protein